MQKNLFISHKASRAIPFTSTVTRDLLIQATLDGDVRRVEYQNKVIIDERIVPVQGIIVERFDGRFAIDIVDARPVHDPVAEALTQLAFARKCHGIIEINAADVHAEPRCSAARDVWSHHAVRVHADDRAAIREALEIGGPVGLAQLIGSVATRGDARAVVFALACEGAVELDLHDGITEDLIVRSGHTGSAVALRAFGA
ncbi:MULTISPECIES: hypothetical protein [Bradyrhizobium]|uniref:Uncharacterized protein n=1 Tax=Bradyrhizobium barranii subsp. barranii TaxID=2823807 RepID=A0A7Z0TS38_9BRAD|nr:MULTISPECIES: hypothetical protein [Bradyrhizobium]MBR0999312.1 hypothetical protein [Bradyrhizobium liaoningense]MCP1747055.1 hypothetical protein [Bradyrhizobium japonicum]MCP1865687.1 hypothetical protein [Bradyrhizobium japonicum]MCP1895542.1 hypothetical protein [Bradyrhizobium japonicum]MCW2328925.1 hypothetical protein [Bradyrhizobium japonicum]